MPKYKQFKYYQTLQITLEFSYVKVRAIQILPNTPNHVRLYPVPYLPCVVLFLIITSACVGPLLIIPFHTYKTRVCLERLWISGWYLGVSEDVYMLHSVGRHISKHSRLWHNIDCQKRIYGFTFVAHLIHLNNYVGVFSCLNMIYDMFWLLV